MAESSEPFDLLLTGSVILPDRVLLNGYVGVRDGHIAAVGLKDDLLLDQPPLPPLAKGGNYQASPHDVGGNVFAPPLGKGGRGGLTIFDAGDGYISPGFIDLHVHGGHGADFMDGTREAFATVLRAHARHGTTRMLPTTTAARPDQITAVLALCRTFRANPAVDGARVIGAHFYGPYFAREARGCHPAEPIHPPTAEEFNSYLEFSDCITTATIAPEADGAEAFCRACVERGVRVNIGHSHATFDQVRQAIEGGARHVDHLFCAMSDKAKLRAALPYPMRGGVLEATLFFDELTTEVIADGKHLSAELLQLAFKIKGADKLALVTDCNRALDMPEGEYVFGPLDGGEPFLHRDGVGLMPDGRSLASSVRGMDHMVRTFHQLTGRPIWEVVRMASLTPARIAGVERELGGILVGKRADLLLLSPDMHVRRVWIDGKMAHAEARSSQSEFLCGLGAFA